jgi:glycosyltransferase involved in cell wall biosynthesis
LIPPGDAAALACCLDRLVHDRSLLQEMSLAARRRYRLQPTWEQTAGQVRKFLLVQAQ